MQQRRRWLRKRHLKSDVALQKIYRDCSISFNSSNVGNFFFFLELNCRRLYQSSGKEKESRCPLFTSSTKREIRNFHVVVVQWRQSNVQKSVIHVQIVFFFLPNLNLLLLWSSRWRHRRRCLMSLSTLTVLPKHENNRFSILSIYVFSKRFWD